MKKVSIIVPVYNVEAYLEKCLDSLVNQTLKDIEIIIVNDGSPDNSQKIIDRYKRKYPKLIRACKKKNGGLSDARNYGLKYATGEYIGFVDSDDWVDPRAYEMMYNKASNYRFDLVVCDVIVVESEKETIIKSKLKHDVFDQTDLKEAMIDIYPVAWNKLYRRQLFDHDIQFSKGIWFEDVEFLYRLFPHIKHIGVVDEPLNYYLQREGSITNTFDKRVFDYIKNWNNIITYYQDNGFYETYKKELEYCYVRYLYGTFIKQALKYNDFSFYERAIKEAMDAVKAHFPNYRLNAYFYRNLKGLYLIIFNKVTAKLLFQLKHRNKKR